MNSTKLEKLIIRYLSGTLSKKEWEALNDWIEESADSELFRDYVKIDYAIGHIMGGFDRERKKKLVLRRIKKDKARTARLQRLNYLKYAAVIAMAFGTLYFFAPRETEIPSPDKMTQTVESGSKKAVLTLGNGEEVILGKGQVYRNEEVSSNGEELVYAQPDQKEAEGEAVFNYLTVPRGGQYFLQLPDRTKVWVNSDSRIKYPTSFLGAGPRVVELVYGEAYFDVSPAHENNETSFEVLTRGQRVNVLGTEFNIRAYADQKNITTTLAEGRVVVEKEDQRAILKPNEQAIVADNGKQITVAQVDASQITSWVRGLFVFEEKPLDELLEDLSRWYDVEVFFSSEKQKKIPFTGVFERTKSLNELLGLIEAIGDGEVKFELKNKVLLVK